MSCRCKGDIVPWVLWDCEKGDEIDLSELTEEDVLRMFPGERLANILQNSDTYEIGIATIDTTDEIIRLAESDKLTNAKATLMCCFDNISFEKEFTFDYELNVC